MPEVVLVDVYEDMHAAHVLYQLLEERPAQASISHKSMPSVAQHMAFYLSRPYLAWYLICKDEEGLDILGACYLTKHNEIGIALYRNAQGMGYASAALTKLMCRWKWQIKQGTEDIGELRRFLANIAPGNERSKAFFAKHGFRLIQETYESPPV